MHPRQKQIRKNQTENKTIHVNMKTQITITDKQSMPRPLRDDWDWVPSLIYN